MKVTKRGNKAIEKYRNKDGSFFSTEQLSEEATYLSSCIRNWNIGSAILYIFIFLTWDIREPKYITLRILALTVYIIGNLYLFNKKNDLGYALKFYLEVLDDIIKEKITEADK